MKLLDPDVLSNTIVTPTTIAELAGVSVTLGDHPILNDVDLTIRQGETLGIIGGNGTGKSTILKLLTGLLLPTDGTVRVFGEAPTTPRVLHRIGAAIDTPALYPWMSGKQALRTVQDQRGEPDNGTVNAALEKFGLADTGRKPVIRYSQGMRKRLALAAASLNNPELLILDEPTNALDPPARALVNSWMNEAKQNGATIIIVTHRKPEAATCDLLYQLADQTLMPATPDDLDDLT